HCPRFRPRMSPALPTSPVSTRPRAPGKPTEATFASSPTWCRTRDVSPLPALPESVAAFLVFQGESGLAASTISRRGAAVRYAHKLAGHEPPTNSEAVKATLRGIRRTVGTAPRNRKAPAISEMMHKMSRAAHLDAKGIRDRALMLLGFGGAFRRGELVALN